MHCTKHFLQIAHKVLVILVLSGCACTPGDEIVENFKTDLQESIVAARSFRSSIAGFEYTAINIKDYSQISKHVYNLLDNVLNTKAEDFVTVLDIKMNDIASANESDSIVDIFSCLKSYTVNGSEIKHYAINTQMRVHSVKLKNLQNFLAFSDYTDKIRYIHDFIQHKIDTYVNDQIKNSFEVCLLDLLTKTIVKNYLGKCESNNLSITDSIGVIEEIRNAEILVQFVDACDNGTLGDKVFDETILHFNSDLNHIDSIIADVMDFQSNVSHIYYERIEVENFICREYDNKLIDLVNNNITIVLESLVQNLLNLTSEEYEAIYGWFIAKILQAVQSNGYSHSIHSAHIIMDAFEASNDDFELLETSNQFFLKAIRLDDGIKVCKDKNYASDFICLKPFCQKKQIMIICNDRITKMNLDYFCNILGKIGITLGTQQNSFVLINMIQGIDTYGISGHLQKLYTDEFNSCFWMDSNNIINKAITIESKKADNSFLRKSSIDLKSVYSSASFMPTSSDDLAKEIHKTIARNMTVVDGADNITLHLIDNSEIDLVILQNLKAQERNISVSETFVIAVESDQGVNIVQVVFYTDEEGCYVLDLKHNLPTTDRQNEKNCGTENGLILLSYSGTNRAKAISYLSNYLKNVQILPKDYSLPTFTCDILDKFAVKQIEVPIYSNVAGDTDVVIANELVDIIETIANFHDTEKNTSSILSLKIPLSDILRRKIDYGTWINNIKTFLTDTDIDFEDFEYILDTFLIDKNLVNATNNNDMQGINVKNCDVYICAIINKDGNKKIYIIRKDIAFDMQILQTSQLLYAFNDEMNNGIFDDDTHLIQFLRKIKQLGINPLRCIFETILNLNYDLTDNLREQFEANKDEFCTKFYDILNPYLYDKVPVKDDLMFEDFSNPKVLTLLNMSMTKLLEIEISLLLDRLGQCLFKTRHNPRIMITSISLDN